MREGWGTLLRRICVPEAEHSELVRFGFLLEAQNKAVAFVVVQVKTKSGGAVPTGRGLVAIVDLRQMRSWEPSEFLLEAWVDRNEGCGICGLDEVFSYALGTPAKVLLHVYVRQHTGNKGNQYHRCEWADNLPLVHRDCLRASIGPRPCGGKGS